VRRHDAILDATIVEHRGHVFKTIGEAFCAAFARPVDAVAAMLAAQQALAAEDFSAMDGLRVRTAIHTGTADERDGDYFGPPVNKVAWLLAIGHGSQVLITSETGALLDGVLASETSLRDLGAYHLKDFTQPQRVYQLGPTHPDVAYCLNGLALTFRDQGRYQEAEGLLSQALSTRERALGSDHPLTKSTREALDTLRSSK
jgi:class 3 adenylate cyclase